MEVTSCLPSQSATASGLLMALTGPTPITIDWRIYTHNLLHYAGLHRPSKQNSFRSDRWTDLVRQTRLKSHLSALTALPARHHVTGRQQEEVIEGVTEEES